MLKINEMSLERKLLFNIFSAILNSRSARRARRVQPAHRHLTATPKAHAPRGIYPARQRFVATSENGQWKDAFGKAKTPGHHIRELLWLCDFCCEKQRRDR